jgi:ribonuclease HI
VIQNELKPLFPEINITPRPWFPRPQTSDADKGVANFLDLAASRNETVLIYTDGSCRNADTPKATAGSGLFMIMKSDYEKFVTQYQDPHEMNQESYETAFKTEYDRLGNSSRNFDDDKERKKAAGENLFMEFYHRLQESNIPFIKIHGEIVEGPISSWYGEYMAIYKALYYTRTHITIKIEIRTDHKASADLFSCMTTSSMKKLISKIKMTGFPIWSAISYLERKRLGKTCVVWVEAHVGNFGNSFADYLAGLYGEKARETTIPFSCPKDPKQHRVKTILMYGNQVVQEPARKLLGTVNSVLKATAGLQKITQLGLPINNEWHFTLPTINNFVTASTNTGSRKLHHRRANSFKKLAGQLPGQLQLKRMHDSMYPDNLCRLCGCSIEDNNHIWNCTSNLQRQNRKIITDNFKKSLIQLVNPPPNLKPWVVLALEHIPCISDSPSGDGIYPPDRYLFPLQLFPDDRATLLEITRQVQKTTIAQLAVGLLPREITDTFMMIAEVCLKSRYPDPDTRHFDPNMMRRAFYSIQKALYEDFHQYWLDRCLLTVEWEREHNITHAAKRRKRTTNPSEEKRARRPPNRDAEVAAEKKQTTLIRKRAKKETHMQRVNFSKTPRNKTKGRFVIN